MAIDPQYYYLAATMVSVAVAAVLFISMPLERASMLWSGALLTPFAVVEAPLATDYWSPQRLTNGWIGVEDFLWTFVFGAIAWALTATFAGPLPSLRPINRRFATRALAIGLFGGALRFGGLFAGFSYAICTIGAQLCVAAAMVVLHPQWLRLVLGSGVLLLVYYAAGMGLSVATLGTGFAGMWTHDGNTWPLVMGLPLAEYLWVLTFGFAWVPILLFANADGAAQE